MPNPSSPEQEFSFAGTRLHPVSAPSATKNEIYYRNWKRGKSNRNLRHSNLYTHGDYTVYDFHVKTVPSRFLERKLVHRFVRTEESAVNSIFYTSKKIQMSAILNESFSLKKILKCVQLQFLKRDHRKIL